jgi:ribose transport system substrate-binding protein
MNRISLWLATSFALGLLTMTMLTTVVWRGYASDEPLVPVIVKDQSAYYWKIVLAGAEAAGRDLGVKVVGQSGSSEQDVASQIKLLDEAVRNKAVAVVIAPTQYKEPGPAVDEAAKHIPVIIIDSGVASLNMKASLATDNVAAGRLAADAMATAFKAEHGEASGEVAIINFLAGSGSLLDRSKGFKDQLFSQYSDMTVIEERNGDGTEKSIEVIVATILNDHPDLRGIFASNIVTASVAARALKSGNLAGKVELVGFDSSQELADFVTDGTIVGLIVQDPYKMGYDGVKTAVDASRGKGVQQFVDTGATLITRDNINGDREKRLLNPPVD